MRILIADDEPEMTMVLEALLRREHYSVDVVHDGQDALDYGLAENYDCLVLDIMMPKLDGIQVLRALRERNATTPVLLLTAKDQIEDRVAGLDGGADDYLPKPFDNRELVARVRALTRRGGEYTPSVLTAGNIALDCFLQMQSTYNLFRVVILVATACSVMVFILIVFLSKRAVRPFAENLERQRQFITDASHELKTPLAILSANVGFLEDTYGQNKWSESARTQVFRLDKLIKNLVELARTEEMMKEDSVLIFSVSEIAQASVDAFQPLVEADGKTLTAEIASNIHLRGVQDNFFRFFSILLDNAVKYCDPGGVIHFILSHRGRTISISVSNPCAGLDASQLPRYFDRFYRADSSRARTTGGYGIGLSTAKAIVMRHRGRISNHYADGVITFTATIPCTLQK